MNPTHAVHDSKEDRQWDIRINLQTDEYRDDVINAIKSENEKGKFKYILIGGEEIGTKSSQDDYQIRHVHIAVIFNNRASKGSIIKNWRIIKGNGYYMVPRNRELPYSGWRAHHIKTHSKLDATKTLLYESGELPSDATERRGVKRSEAEKKETTDEILRKIRKLLEEGRDDEAFNAYPRNFTIYGERLKSMIHQKLQTGPRGHPHMWVYGFPGTGKTAILAYIYPKMYKKPLENRFFDLYSEKEHTHVMLEDLDHATVDKLGIQFLKTICDERGFPIDQKYKTPRPTVSTVLVTSNFEIDEVVPEGKGVEETKMALHRRFFQIRVDSLLRFLSLKLIPPYERKQLAKNKNNDPGKVFMTWDYVTDRPMGLPIKAPEEYQNLIRNIYYR